MTPPYLAALLLASMSAMLSTSAWSAAASNSSFNYIAFELEREDNWDSLIKRDLNGDGRLDLVYSHYAPDRGRELYVHYQLSDGSFQDNPQAIEIKTEIIAVGFADLRDTPGDELLLFADRGVFSLSSQIEGYAGNLRPLLQWPLIATVPDRERVEFISSFPDINDDGYIDLVLPGDFEYGVFLGGPDESFSKTSQFDVINQDLPPSRRSPAQTDLEARLAINAEEGVVVELAVERLSPFAGFVNQEQLSQDSNETLNLMDSERWIPTAMLARLNDDLLLDALYINLGSDGLGQFNLHYQSESGIFSSQPDWTGSLDTRGRVLIEDFNGDGLDDLIRIDDDGDEWTAYFFANADGSFDLSEPTQVMRFTGYDLNLDFVRVAEDSTPLLSASFYTIPVVDAIRNASITRTQLLYHPDQSAAFARRPSMRLDESFSAANVRGLSEQTSFRYDVDGDGRKDALYITEAGTLAAKRVQDDLTLEPDPFWEYVSERGVFEFEVLQMNQDALPDLLLRHGRTTTVLIASAAGL